MKKKKTLWSVATGALLLVSLSFGSGVSAMDEDVGSGGGGSLPPKCIPGKPCPIGP